MQSNIYNLGKIADFPEFTGERLYMIPFITHSSLPDEYNRWQGTVDEMLTMVPSGLNAYLMVDQSTVFKGNSHRRPGIHVDMYWGANDHRHSPLPPNIPSHNKSGIFQNEALILTSNVLGCVGYEGVWSGIFNKENGDCSNIDVSHLTRINFEPNYIYTGHTLHMLHESIPVLQDCNRTVVRLNIQGWSL